MKRNIVQIDEKKCNGCGACADACHEGAIEMKSGKARLIRDDYCDGLGDCLPVCPTGAISITVREAEAYDEQAVQAKKQGSHVVVPAHSLRYSLVTDNEVNRIVSCQESRAGYFLNGRCKSNWRLSTRRILMVQNY